MWIPRVQDHAKRVFRNSPALQRPPTLPVEGLGFRGLGFKGLGCSVLGLGLGVFRE